MLTQTINLNMAPGAVSPVIHVSQYDTDEDALVFNLYDGAAPFTAGTTATIVGTKPDGYGFTYAASYSGNVVTADLTQQMTAVSGQVMCEVRITDVDNTVGSQNFVLQVEPAALADNAVISDSDIPLLQQAVDAAATATTAVSEIYGTGIKINANSSINSLTTGGKYYIDASTASGGTVTGYPSSNGGTLFVYATWNVARPVQIVYDINGDMYIRGKYGNSDAQWSSWKKVTTTEVS